MHFSPLALVDVPALEARLRYEASPRFVTDHADELSAAMLARLSELASFVVIEPVACTSASAVRARVAGAVANIDAFLAGRAMNVVQ